MSVRTAVLPRLVRLPRLRHWLARALAVRRQRAHLMALDDHLLRDIGLTRADADLEATRPFWDAPERWHADD